MRNRGWTCQALVASLFVLLFCAIGIRASAQDSVLPRPQPPFQGKIGRTATESTPDFPKGIEAPKDAPNILLILTDDVGFGASTFWRADPDADVPAACGQRLAL